MKLLLAATVLVVVLSTGLESASAEEVSRSSSGFSTVKLYFMNAWLPDPELEEAGGEASLPGLGGGMGGGMMSAQMRFRTVRLFLDEKFIGHAMFRHVDVTPTLNLEAGERKFRIECEGYEKFEKTLTVLRNGSTQWLVVELKPAQRPKKQSDAPATNK